MADAADAGHTIARAVEVVVVAAVMLRMAFRIVAAVVHWETQEAGVPNIGWAKKAGGRIWAMEVGSDHPQRVAGAHTANVLDNAVKKWRMVVDEDDL